jgi:hypothetical protein
MEPVQANMRRKYAQVNGKRDGRLLWLPGVRSSNSRVAYNLGKNSFLDPTAF